MLDEKALLARVVGLYDIPSPEGCSFYCRGDADIYEVRADESRYYLKVYRPEYRLAQVESEGRLVADLAAAGVPVVEPVGLKAGGFALAVQAAEGIRSMLLHRRAPDGRIAGPDLAVCRSLGKAVARLHDALDALAGEYDLPAFDSMTFDELLPYAETVFSDEDHRFLRATAERIRPRLAAMPDRPPDFGICHSDLVLSNIRLRDDEVVFFDFGTAGRTWRAYELVVLECSVPVPEEDGRQPLRDALLDGYASVRPLPSHLAESRPWLQLARTLSWLGGNAATLPLRLGSQPLEEEIFTKTIARVRELANNLPGEPSSV